MGKPKSGRHANHTKYSDYMILYGVENRNSSKKSPAFRKIAEELGMTEKQVSSRHHVLTTQGLTSEDFADYTEEDKKNFDPGQAPIQKGPVTRKKFPEGYDKHEDEWISRTPEEMIENIAEAHPEAKRIIDIPPTQEEINQALNEKNIYDSGFQAGHNDGYEKGQIQALLSVIEHTLSRVLSHIDREEKVKLVNTIIQSM